MYNEQLVNRHIGHKLLVGLMTAGVLSLGMATPAAAAVGTNAVTGPGVINIANVGSVVVSGTAESAVTSVTVAIDDQNGFTDAVVDTITISGIATQQSWSSAGMDVSGLDDGPLTIFSSYDTAGNTAGPATTDPVVEKDTIEPDFPTTQSDDTVSYTEAQQVVISALDPADQVRTHYTVGTPTAPDPTSSSPLVAGPLTLTKTQQLKAISFDAAGNPSTILVMNFVINIPVPPVVTPTPTNPPTTNPTPTTPTTTPPVSKPPVITPPAAKPPVVKPAVSARITKVVAAGAEYAAIKNTGKVAFNLAGWKLKDRSGKTLTLKSYTLKPGATVKVYTGKGTKALGKSFLRKKADVWSKHDTARLYNTRGVKVASMTY